MSVGKLTFDAAHPHTLQEIFSPSWYDVIVERDGPMTDEAEEPDVLHGSLLLGDQWYIAQGGDA